MPPALPETSIGETMAYSPCHHHESREVTLLKISARANLPLCHLKMVLFFRDSGFSSYASKFVYILCLFHDDLLC